MPQKEPLDDELRYVEQTDCDRSSCFFQITSVGCVEEPSSPYELHMSSFMAKVTAVHIK